MATITLKNIPANIHRELKKCAEEHHRSLNREIIATLKSATGGPIPFDPTKLEEFVRQARSLFRRPITGREIAGSKGVHGFDLGGSSTSFEIEMLGL